MSYESENAGRIIEAMAGLYPIPQIENPDWDDSDMVPRMIPEFTVQQWAKQAIMRRTINDVLRWERGVVKRAARNSVVRDNTLLT
jgi:hypothetical protein